MRRLCLFLFVLCLSISARADSFTTFNLNATFTGGVTASGTVTLNTTANSFSSVNILVSGNSAVNGTYTSIFLQGFNGNYYAEFTTDSIDQQLLLNLPVGNLSGYAGSAICIQSSGCTNPTKVYLSNPFTQFLALSGTVSPQVAATPEPSTLVYLATGLLVAGYTQRRRIFA